MGSGLGPRSGGRQFTWRWKSKCLVNKCLLGHSETMRPREKFYKQTLLRSSLSTQLVHTIVIYDDSSLPETGSLSNSFRQLGEGQSFFLSLVGLDGFHAKETFVVSKPCSSILLAQKCNAARQVL